MAEYERAHFQAWRRELAEAHLAGALRFRMGHLLGVSGLPRFELPDHAPTAIAELELDLHDVEQLAALGQTIARRVWRGLVKCTIRLHTALDDDQGGELLQMLWRSSPHLRELRLRGGAGHLRAGPRTSAALQQLLLRHRTIVCGEALELLHLDIEAPSQGWTCAPVADLIEALAPAGLRELELRSSSIPEHLRNWTRYSGFAARLSRCELRARCSLAVARRSSVALAGPRPRLPGRVAPDCEAFLVWADWLQARGEPLGELALLWAGAGGSNDQATSGELRRAQARVEHTLGAGREQLISCEWSGPLVSRLWIRARASSSEALLRRALGSEACVGVEQLTIEDASPATLSILQRCASERGPQANVGELLARLDALQLAGSQALALGGLLDALPGLARLRCSARAWTLASAGPHPGLHTLELALTTDLDHRSCARNFARLGASGFPNLRELTLDIEPRTGGPALPFERLELRPELHLRIRGQLREADIDALLRCCNRAELALLELVDPQPWTVERKLMASLRRHRRLSLASPRLALARWKTPVVLAASVARAAS